VGALDRHLKARLVISCRFIIEMFHFYRGNSAKTPELEPHFVSVQSTDSYEQFEQDTGLGLKIEMLLWTQLPMMEVSPSCSLKSSSKVNREVSRI
jgi:hypothetical protein